MNEFLKNVAELKVAADGCAIPGLMYYINHIAYNIEDNKKLDVKKAVFNWYYRYNDFEIEGVLPTTGNLFFHQKGKNSYSKNFESENGEYDSWPAWESIATFYHPRLRRDFILAWSIRKDFYKYHIKFRIDDLETLLKQTELIEGFLPREENIFFWMRDGLYLCNPISDIHLNKMKELFGDENVFVNDHELYFELDKDMYYPNIRVSRGKHCGFEGRKYVYYTEPLVFKSTYSLAYINFHQKRFKVNRHELGVELNETLLYLRNLKDTAFLKQFDPNGKFAFIDCWINRKSYDIFMDMEWKRIPSWYKEFVTEDMLNIKWPDKIWKIVKKEYEWPTN